MQVGLELRKSGKTSQVEMKNQKHKWDISSAGQLSGTRQLPMGVPEAMRIGN
jgi:hypothetical protein